MTDFPAPSCIVRPTPTATWHVEGQTGARTHGFAVSRQDEEVQIHGHGGKLRMPPAVASRLADTLTAAAVWTDEPDDLVDAEIVDYQQTVDGDLVHDVVLDACPPWVSDQAAKELAHNVLAGLTRVEGVTVTRGIYSRPWTPDTEPDNQTAEIASEGR